MDIRLEIQRGLRWADMTEHGPDKDNRRNRIEPGEQEAAVEGGRRPQRRRCFKPEGALTLSARIAKEPLDPIEEFGQAFRIEPCREMPPARLARNAS